MAKYEEKFIVINRKHIEELNDTHVDGFLRDAPESVMLFKALEEFRNAYEENTGKKLDQKYYVVNQDEPYADNVIKMILYHENKKELRDGNNE